MVVVGGGGGEAAVKVIALVNSKDHLENWQ